MRGKKERATPTLTLSVSGQVHNCWQCEKKSANLSVGASIVFIVDCYCQCHVQVSCHKKKTKKQKHFCPCVLGAINYSLRRQDVSLEPWRVSREADAKLFVCKVDTLQPAGVTPQIVGCCSLTWGIHQISLSSRR